ncbi:ycf20-like protein [Elaeis guineensis]|uniref:Ycf20-like protein isoform X2 n=1 Tax=Elaeis guineensis var. tenera TaxID=51953 RepID=A0A6I9RWR6_ELAGV|nr:ycf20-like protein isoform X2 [Elaeis guineensis]XP_029123074.1 ycf20-like protein isoform X2 [Elaeis guineensis]
MTMATVVVQRGSPAMNRECLGRHHSSVISCGAIDCWSLGTHLGRRVVEFGARPKPFHEISRQMRSNRSRLAFALDTGGSPSTDDQDSPEGDNAGLGRTRLGTIVRAAARQLLEKLNATRKNFPMKIFLLLLGFYTANALATILGQTGDWDVLVAGVVVAAIEGIGMLMYRKPFTMPIGRLQSLVVMVNYWKAGVCLGLFVDAFKLGS